MSIKKDTELDHFIVGGDAIWHKLYIAAVGYLRTLGIAFAIGVTVSSLVFFLATNASQRKVIYANYTASLMLMAGANHYVSLPVGDGTKQVKADYAVQLTDPYVAVFKYRAIAFFSLLAGAVAMGALFRKLVRFQKKYGENEGEDEFIRGQQLVDSSVLRDMTKNQSMLGFEVGDVPIPDAMLMRNFSFIGNPGTGKSRAIFHGLDALRGKVKAVIYDRTGDYVERYYDPNNDYILNPFDERCAAWSIFYDLRSEVDYATVANYFVLEKKEDKNSVFTQGARILFEDVIRLVQIDPQFKKTMGEVARVATAMDLQQLYELMVKYGFPSAGTINPAAEETAQSVRFTLAAQPGIRFFRHMDMAACNGNRFSIRDFIESETTGWLFILSHPEVHELVKPFASAWIELAMLAAMGGDQIDRVRLVFAIDELGSLPVLDAVKTGLTEARKYGVAILLGFQTAAHIDAIWGKELRNVLLANTQTKAIFRTEDANTAKDLSETIGRQELREASDGVSFGAETGKDSRQVSHKRAEVNLVLASELQTLPDRTAILKVVGNYPIAKVRIPDTPDRKVAEAYRKNLPKPLVATVPQVDITDSPAPAVAEAKPREVRGIFDDLDERDR